MSVYLYTLKKPFSYRTELLSGVSFQNEWLKIDVDGTVTISAEYAWDGCSPKWYVAGYTLGVPDGPMMGDGYPQTAWASLVHDALCQFKHLVPITKRQSVAVFDELLRIARWRFRTVYVKAVDLFGPQRFAGDLQQGGV
jgi:hypothetical protein